MVAVGPAERSHYERSYFCAGVGCLLIVPQAWLHEVCEMGTLGDRPQYRTRRPRGNTTPISATCSITGGGRLTAFLGISATVND